MVNQAGAGHAISETTLYNALKQLQTQRGDFTANIHTRSSIENAIFLRLVMQRLKQDG